MKSKKLKRALTTYNDFVNYLYKSINLSKNRTMESIQDYMNNVEYDIFKLNMIDKRKVILTFIEETQFRTTTETYIIDTWKLYHSLVKTFNDNTMNEKGNFNLPKYIFWNRAELKDNFPFDNGY